MVALGHRPLLLRLRTLFSLGQYQTRRSARCYNGGARDLHLPFLRLFALVLVVQRHAGTAMP
eukprot:2159661-Rhodomonas_salina.2